MGCLTPLQAVSLYTGRNPYVSALAYANSNYSVCHDGALVRVLDWRKPSARATLAHRSLRSFLTGSRFSCVGARAAVASGGYRYGHYRSMTDAAAIEGLARDLCAFVAEYPSIETRYKTFIATFGRNVDGEEAFEKAMWSLLQSLHDLDERYFPYDAAVSSDPSDPRFAFSFAGAAFFVVGLHPHASRVSRRFAMPALAFNPHDQFAALRRSGHFERVRQNVREREIALQNSLNPNLAEFGESSEARQYSGRAVEEAWRCPFHAR